MNKEQLVTAIAAETYVSQAVATKVLNASKISSSFSRLNKASRQLLLTKQVAHVMIKSC